VSGGVHTTLGVTIQSFSLNYLVADNKVPDTDTLDGHDSLYFQRRIASTCAAGYAMRVINADGTVSCEFVGGSGGSLSGAEVDPVFIASAVAGISAGDISNRNTAYARGNHASMGYLTTESDPKVGTLSNGKRCYTNGTQIICNQDQPTGITGAT